MTANTSKFTAIKQAEFARIMAFHINIVKTVLSNPRNSWMRKTYFYLDLNAGPGAYDDENYCGDGSPVIAVRALRHASMKYRCALVNNDLEECKMLHRAFENDRSVSIHYNDNRDAIKRTSPPSKSMGLAYFDPNNIMPDFELAKMVEDRYRMLDLLFYFGATPVKRVRRAFNRPVGEGHSLTERMVRLNKSRWIVKEPFGAQQYSFLLGTNGNFSDWKRTGWHDIESESGLEILETLNLTIGERARQLELI